MNLPRKGRGDITGRLVRPKGAKRPLPAFRAYVEYYTDEYERSLSLTNEYFSSIRTDVSTLRQSMHRSPKFFGALLSATLRAMARSASILMNFNIRRMHS